MDLSWDFNGSPMGTPMGIPLGSCGFAVANGVPMGLPRWSHGTSVADHYSWCSLGISVGRPWDFSATMGRP